MRLVLDTNVLLSGLVFGGGPPATLLRAWRDGSFGLVLSDWLVEELTRTLPPLASKRGFDLEAQRDMVHSVCLAGELVQLDLAVLASAATCGLRDPCDVPVLATLMTSKADYLITGDKDLLVLADRFPIITPAAFCARHAP